MLIFLDNKLFSLQLPIIDEQNVKLQKNVNSHQLNIAELFGMKKIDTNELLINFLAFELCKSGQVVFIENIFTYLVLYLQLFFR